MGFIKFCDRGKEPANQQQPSPRRINEKCRESLQTFFSKRETFVAIIVLQLIDLIFVFTNVFLAIKPEKGDTKNMDPWYKPWLIYSALFLDCLNILRLILVTYTDPAKCLRKPTFWMDWCFGLISPVFDVYELRDSNIGSCPTFVFANMLVCFFRISLTFYDFSQIEVRKLKQRVSAMEKGEPVSISVVGQLPKEETVKKLDSVVIAAVDPA